jgi:hypothetical protein
MRLNVAASPSWSRRRELSDPITEEENHIVGDSSLMLRQLRERAEWKFFAVLPRAGGTLAVVWWVVLVLRGVLPAAFAIAMGVLVGAVQRGGPLVGRVGDRLSGPTADESKCDEHA